MKTRSASLMAESMSVEKNKFLFLHDSTTSLRPGWGWGDVEKKREKVCQCTRLCVGGTRHGQGKKSGVSRDMTPDNSDLSASYGRPTLCGLTSRRTLTNIGRGWGSAFKL